MWKLIPGSDNFYINDYGDVEDQYGFSRRQYLNGDGYLTVAIKVLGKWVTYGVGRLVAITFHESERSDERNVVNHRDLDKLNNYKGNLEWLTVGENNVHLAVSNMDSKRDTVLGVDRNGREVRGLHLHDISEKTGIYFLDVWDSIKYQDGVNGWYFTHIPFDARLTDDLRKPRFSTRDRLGRKEQVKVFVKNLNSGETISYGSVQEAASALGVRTNTVSYKITEECKSPFIDDFELSATPTFRDYIPVPSTGSREVFVLEIETGKSIYYPSAKEFYLSRSLSKKAVTTILAKDTGRVLEGLVFTYSDNCETVSEIIRRYACPDN